MGVTATMFSIITLCFITSSVTSLVIPSIPDSVPVNTTGSDQDCPMVGLDCLSNDIERAYNSQTWQECAVQCASHRTCAYWSWRVPSSDVNPYGCWLKSGCPFTVADSRLVSGDYTCTAREQAGVSSVE